MALQGDGPLPERADVMGRQLLRKVLTTTKELRSNTGLSEDQAKRGLRDLRKRNFVASAEFGCLLPGVNHSWLTEDGLDHFEASAEQRSWHSAAGVGNLILYDLPTVEAVNEIATIYPGEGWTLSGIQWYERQPMAAVAEYSPGPDERPAYLPFIRAPLMDNEWELCSRLEALPGALRAHSWIPDENFYPSGLCIVAVDEWGAARALSMAYRLLSPWVPETHITAWFHDGGGWNVSDGTSVLTGLRPTALPPFLDPLDLLNPATSVRSLGRRRFDRVIDRCPWAGRAGQARFIVLTLLGQYPVISVAHLKALAGEGRNGDETERRLTKLVHMGLAEIVAPKARATARRVPAGVPVTISDRGQGGHHYALTKAGRSAFCRTHGGSPADLASRSGLSSFHKGTWSFRHQDGVYEVLAQCREEGCAVAPGWLAHATLADGRRIEPDGAVLCDTQWGRVWCYLEVELSDRSFKAFKPRCEKYGSEHRLDFHPLLMVCLNDLSEENFYRAACEYAPGLRVLTTTLRRLRDSGMFGCGTWLC